MKKLLFDTPLFLLFVLFSLNSFAQLDTSKQNSEHPLLDKYYPRPKNEPVAKNPVIKSTAVQQKNVIAAPKNKPIEEKRLTFPTPVQRPEIVAVPVIIKDSVAAKVETTIITPPISTGVAITDSKTVTPISDSVKMAKPVILAAKNTLPPAQKSASKIETGYQRNRLGSSSPLYNTYEKNAKGAGSVTTLPKR